MTNKFNKKYAKCEQVIIEAFSFVCCKEFLDKHYHELPNLPQVFFGANLSVFSISDILIRIIVSVALNSFSRTFATNL